MPGCDLRKETSEDVDWFGFVVPDFNWSINEFIESRLDSYKNTLNDSVKVTIYYRSLDINLDQQ